MYKPLFNKVLVEIQESVEDKYGKSGDDNLGGKAYREGKLIATGSYFATKDYPVRADEIVPEIEAMLGKTVMWHEGHEAGTVFEEDGKLYALIYWFDIAGVKSSDE